MWKHNYKLFSSLYLSYSPKIGQRNKVEKVILRNERSSKLKKNRTQYSKEYNAKEAIESLKEQKTLNAIASQFQIHPNQVTKWKKQLLEESGTILKISGKKAG